MAYLRMVEWAHANGYKPSGRAVGNCYFDTETWAVEQKCPWHERTYLRAAWDGELETLEWAHRHGCAWKTGRPVLRNT